MSQLQKNARWLALTQFIKVILQLISVVVLARLLEPESYGLMAITSAITTFASLFRDLGISAAIIQANVVDEKIKNSSFALSLMLGIFIGLIVCGLAHPLALLFNEPILKEILLVSSITFPLTSLSAVHQSLLERENKFQTLARIEVISQSIALAAAIFSAFHDFGVYSLVIQVMTASTLSTIQIFSTNKWRPSFSVDIKSIRKIFNFSIGLTGFNTINYFARNADTFLIGRLLGPTPLGIYNTAYKIMLLPLQSVTLVSNRALYPVLSRLQSDLPNFREKYYNSISFVSTLTFPLMAGIWATRSPFVIVFFGEKWGGLESIIAWLAPTGMIQSILSTSGVIFMALGKTNQLFKLGIFGACIQVTGIFIGAIYEIKYAAIGYFFANIINALPVIWVASKLINSSSYVFFSKITPPLIASTIMAAFCNIFIIISNNKFSSLTQLIIATGIGFFVYTIILKFLFPIFWEIILSSIFKRSIK